jgi:hypothetical protein
MTTGAIENIGADLGGIINGDITIINADCIGIDARVGIAVSIKNCSFGIMTLVATAPITFIIEDTIVRDYFNLVHSIPGSTLNLRNFKVGFEIDPGIGSNNPNFISGFKNVLVWNSFINNSYSLLSPGTDPALYIDTCETILIKDSVLNNIDDVDTQTGTALSVVQIDSAVLVSAKIIHTSVMGGVLAIDSLGLITVDTFSQYSQQPNGAGVTINPL